jgi:hypothetical protein
MLSQPMRGDSHVEEEEHRQDKNICEQGSAEGCPGQKSYDRNPALELQAGECACDVGPTQGHDDRRDREGDWLAAA